MAIINPYILHLLSGKKFRVEGAAKARREAAQSKKDMEDQLDIYNRDINALESPPQVTGKTGKVTSKETLNQRLEREQKLRKLNKERFELIEKYQTEHAPKTEKLEFDPDEDYKTSDPSAKIDRPDEVLQEFEAQLNSGEIRKGANTELEMDRVHNELIQKGELSVEPVQSEALQTAFTHSQKIAPKRQSKKQLERESPQTGDPKEKIKVSNKRLNQLKLEKWKGKTGSGMVPRGVVIAAQRKMFPDTKPAEKRVAPLRETSDMTLEELQRTTNQPITGKEEPGEASGLTRVEPTDQIDVLGRNRADALRATIDELPPHLQTPENIRILAREVIQEDVSDKATGQVFGRSTEAYPKVRDPDIENFSLRQLEDIFIEGVDPKAKQHIPGVDMMKMGPKIKGKSPRLTKEYKGDEFGPARREALKRVRREAAQAATKSGRTNIIKDELTGENRYIPQTHRRFIKDPQHMGHIKTNKQQLERILKRPDQAPLEAVQEKLTGPLRPDVDEARRAAKVKSTRKIEDLKQGRKLSEDLKNQETAVQRLLNPERVKAEELLMELLGESELTPEQLSLFALKEIPHAYGPRAGRPGFSKTRSTGRVIPERHVAEAKGPRTTEELSRQRRVGAKQGPPVPEHLIGPLFEAIQNKGGIVSRRPKEFTNKRPPGSGTGVPIVWRDRFTSDFPASSEDSLRDILMNILYGNAEPSLFPPHALPYDFGPLKVK
jgi:hypothetical protein